MTPQQTIEQAIEALERSDVEGRNEALRSLRTLLEQMKKQEPVAKVKKCHMDDRDWLDIDPLVPHDSFTNGQLLYSTPQLPQREGWQLVPVEPTGEMLQAAFTYLEDIDFIATGVYKAMLAAAPKPTEDE